MLILIITLVSVFQYKKALVRRDRHRDGAAKGNAYLIFTHMHVGCDLVGQQMYQTETRRGCKKRNTRTRKHTLSFPVVSFGSVSTTRPALPVKRCIPHLLGANDLNIGVRTP
jgi:hypothetical protein